MAYICSDAIGPVEADYAPEIDRVVIRVGTGGRVHLDLPEARMLRADLDKAIAAAEAVTAVSK